MQHIAKIMVVEQHTFIIDLSFYRISYLKNLITSDVWWKVLNCSCMKLMVSDL